MADNVTPRLRLPKTAAKDEVVQIRTLITHPMESGLRKDDGGQPIPRAIINRFTLHFNGALVVEVAMEPAISANPYFEFHAQIPESGEFTFAWHDDDGSVYRDRHWIEVI